MPAIPTPPVPSRRCTSRFSIRPSRTPRPARTCSFIATSPAERRRRKVAMAPDVDARRSRADPFAPLTSEHLAVTDGHEVYVESVGHIGGIAAVYLHGGPGSGCQPDHRRLFDPARFPPGLFATRVARRA